MCSKLCTPYALLALLRIAEVTAAAEDRAYVHGYYLNNLDHPYLQGSEGRRAQ